MQLVNLGVPVYVMSQYGIFQQYLNNMFKYVYKRYNIHNDIMYIKINIKTNYTERRGKRYET